MLLERAFRVLTGLSRCRNVPLTHARSTLRCSSTQTPVDAEVKPDAEKEGRENRESKNKLLSQLIAKIRVGGPMTIADYMREALTHPVEGYYMKGDVFGVRGDFTTSPEISPMFGEMLGVWFLNEWMKLGQPSPVNIVELGPGRGTLISDILRVMSKYEVFQRNSALHLVEVSPGLTDFQKNVLCSDPRPPVDPNRPPMPVNDMMGQDATQSKFGIPVYWHSVYETVPRGYFTLWLAHEFLDALPVHLLRKVDGRWKEVLVDEDPNRPGKLRYVISRHGTPIARAFVKDDEKRNYAEIRPQAAVMTQNIGKRIHEDGGFFLAVDYGHDGQEKDSFRAYKKHEQVEPLTDPGRADLTADVDFGDLRKWASGEGNEVLCYGPTPQGEFLHNLGIRVRLQRLLDVCKNEDEKKSLLTGFDMITAPHQMGEKFKVFSVFPGTVKEIHQAYPPAGFFPMPKVTNIQEKSVLEIESSEEKLSEMKLVQYRDVARQLCVGILAPWNPEFVVPCPGHRRVLDIVKAPELPPVPENVPGMKLLKLADLELLPPVTDQDKVLCVGMNYKDHCEEQNAPIPKEPVLFSKFSSSLVGHGASIKFNPSLTQEVDYEVELAVIIGKPGKNIALSSAMEHVFGYTVANDVSSRDWQLGGRNAGQWFLGKTMDTFCPLGPWIATKDEIGDQEVHSLPVKCRVNGKTLQDSSTEQLIFKIPDVIAFASQFFTLLPGDVILTGTPPGVGVFRNPKIFLQDGDVVECEIGKLGVLRNPVKCEK